MKKKTENIIKGLGVAMAVGSVIASATATMGTSSSKTKKNMKQDMTSKGKRNMTHNMSTKKRNMSHNMTLKKKH